MKSFEKFLEEKCFEDNPTVLDDDMPDFFDAWLGEQDVDSMMMYAQMWMDSTLREVANEVRRII